MATTALAVTQQSAEEESFVFTEATQAVAFLEAIQALADWAEVANIDVLSTIEIIRTMRRLQLYALSGSAAGGAA